MRTQPCDIVAKILCNGGQRHVRTRIALKNLAEQQGHRPTVEDRVMIGPEESISRVTEHDQRDAHQRGHAKIEASRAIAGQQKFEATRLFIGRMVTPVDHIERQSDRMPDGLQRLLLMQADEQRLERVMAVHDGFPSTPESLDVE
nr:hypothetical protein [Burkholderia pyrrocinia]